MNILLVNQFFWPDSAPTGQLLTDVACELARRGHHVEVICGGVGYASDDSGTNARNVPSGIRIRRSPTFRFARGTAGRVLSYASFLGSAFTSSLTCPKPDLVVTLTTPPLLSALGTFLKTVRGARHFIWEMDVYPDVAVALDYLKPNGLVTRISKLIGDHSRRKADGILVLGECMRDVILRHGVHADRIHVAENWSDGDTIEPTPIEDDGRFTLLYSGNLGLAHDVGTIEQAMLRLKDDPRFRFVFAGGGAHHKPLAARCSQAELPNVQFRSYCAKADLGRSLSEGDAGLVTQRNDCTGLVVPSKVYGIMAAARPLLFVGPAEATPGRIIERFGCGWRVDCGDVDGLVRTLQHLAGLPEAVRTAGNNARQAFIEHYDRPHGVDRICRALDPRPDREQRPFNRSEGKGSEEKDAEQPAPLAIR